MLWVSKGNIWLESVVGRPSHNSMGEFARMGRQMLHLLFHVSVLQG